MPKITLHIRLLLLGALALPVSAQELKPSSQTLFPGVSATATNTVFPGFSATATDAVLAGVAPTPIGSKPLTAPPSVIGLPHLEPAQMSDADNGLVSNLRAELSMQAARSNFDISNVAWHYQQIICAALPNDVFLAFSRGPDEEGSSRFVAILPRNKGQVRIVSTYAHGLLPFEGSWNRPGSLEIFNAMLRQERGHTPLSDAPNWLLIGMCYAEVSGYPVEVPTTLPNPNPTLDLLRLDANRPQLIVEPDQGVNVTFSDVSRPAVTTNWNLRFNGQGEITSASRELARQAPTIALKP